MENTKIVSGPGLNYALLAIVNPGFNVEVVGRGEGGGWLVVLVGANSTGWVPMESVRFEHDPGSLTEFEAPPVPPPTQTPAPVPVIWHEFSGPGLWGQPFDSKVCIKISGLQPLESFEMQIDYVGPETERSYYRTYTATSNGNSSESCLRADPGHYTIRFVRNDGSVIVYTFEIFGPLPTDTKTPEP